MKNKKHLLICTCTVVPRVNRGLRRNNSKTRLQDYLNSLTYLFFQVRKLKNFDILIIENSGNINSLKLELVKHKFYNEIRHRVIFVNGRLDKVSTVQGISAGEHRMLRDVSLLSVINDYKTIWKISGRINVRNLNKILIKSSGDLIANRYFGNGHVFDTRIFGMSKIVFKDFVKNIPVYSTKSARTTSSKAAYTSIELYLAQYSLRIENCGMLVNSLARLPVYVGTSASTGKKLNTFKSLLATRIANLIRRVVVKALIGIGP
jgi:hypothetical protein